MLAEIQIAPTIVAVLFFTFCAYWLANLWKCLGRKDFRPLDKFFWFAVLIIPIVGLILYRGLGHEFYKRRPGGEPRINRGPSQDRNSDTKPV